MEELQKTLKDSACALYDSAKSTASQVTAPLRKEATALLTDTVQPALDRYQQLHDTALAHYAATEELVLSRVDEGVKLAHEHPNTAAVTVSLLVLPYTRRALWSSTFGRLQSDASRLAAAERRLAGCSQTLELQGRELGKLTERATLASDEYTRGRSKLLAAGGQLRSLAKQARKTESRLQGLVDDVRRLKVAAGEVPQPLGTKAAEAAAEASRQRSSVERSLRSVAGLVPV